VATEEEEHTEETSHPPCSSEEGRNPTAGGRPEGIAATKLIETAMGTSCAKGLAKNNFKAKRDVYATSAAS
jgi:hypothetical protein